MRIEHGSTQLVQTTRRADRPANAEPALRQLERSVKARLPARAAEVVERPLDDGTDASRSWAARWVTDTDSEPPELSRERRDETGGVVPVRV